jgi:hypothetical protein
LDAEDFNDQRAHRRAAREAHAYGAAPSGSLHNVARSSSANSPRHRVDVPSDWTLNALRSTAPPASIFKARPGMSAITSEKSSPLALRHSVHGSESSPAAGRSSAAARLASRGIAAYVSSPRTDAPLTSAEAVVLLSRSSSSAHVSPLRLQRSRTPAAAAGRSYAESSGRERTRAADLADESVDTSGRQWFKGVVGGKSGYRVEGSVNNFRVQGSVRRHRVARENALLAKRTEARETSRAGADAEVRRRGYAITPRSSSGSWSPASSQGYNESPGSRNEPNANGDGDAASAFERLYTAPAEASEPQPQPRRSPAVPDAEHAKMLASALGTWADRTDTALRTSGRDQHTEGAIDLHQEEVRSAAQAEAASAVGKRAGLAATEQDAGSPIAAAQARSAKAAARRVELGAELRSLREKMGPQDPVLLGEAEQATATPIGRDDSMDTSPGTASGGGAGAKSPDKTATDGRRFAAELIGQFDENGDGAHRFSTHLSEVHRCCPRA